MLGRETAADPPNTLSIYLFIYLYLRRAKVISFELKLSKFFKIQPSAALDILQHAA